MGFLLPFSHSLSLSQRPNNSVTTMSILVSRSNLVYLFIYLFYFSIFFHPSHSSANAFGLFDHPIFHVFFCIYSNFCFKRIYEYRVYLFLCFILSTVHLSSFLFNQFTYAIVHILFFNLLRICDESLVQARSHRFGLY